MAVCLVDGGEMQGVFVSEHMTTTGRVHEWYSVVEVVDRLDANGKESYLVPVCASISAR